MDGDVHLDEVERAIGHRLPEGDYETVAGLLIAETGDLPEAGEVIAVELPQDPAELIADEPMRHSLSIEVLEVERHVPSEVRVRMVSTPAGDDDAADAAGDEDEEVTR